MPFVALTRPQDDSQRDERRGFVPLAGASTPRSGFVPLEADDQAKPSLLRHLLLNNPVTGLGETAINVATQGVAIPAAGLAGLATEAGRAVGLTERKGADVVHSVGDALTYQPRGETGQLLARAVAYPFEKLAQGGRYVGEKVQDATGSALAATAVDTAINALPMVVVPAWRAARGARPAAQPEPMPDAPAPAAPGSAGAAAAQTSTPTQPAARGPGGPATVASPSQAMTIEPRPAAALDRLAPDADIASDLAAGAGELARIEHAGAPASGAMKQAGIHGENLSPEAAQLADFLADNARDKTKLAEFEAAYRAAMQDDPAAPVLAGQARTPTGGDAIPVAERQTPHVEKTPEQEGPAIQRAQAAEQGGWQPEDAPGRGAGDRVAGPAGAAADNIKREAGQDRPDWVAFPEDTGTLGVPRAEMPQIKAEHRGAMVNFLAARGITHKSVEVPAAQLRPTQAEFSPAKVASAREFPAGDRSILISRDNYVLDGHHQWLSKIETGEPVKAIRLDAPIADLIERVKEFPSAEAAHGATTAAGQVRTGPAGARYALVEADNIKPSHNVDLRETPGYPSNFGRRDWTRADAEQRVSTIVQDFDQRRLVESADDATGAPILARDGVVEAGNARAIALQRIYQANGQKAENYRQFLADNATRLGLDQAAVLGMKKPVLVRVPDEPMARQSASADLPPDGQANAFSPGANYVGFVDDTPRPGSGGAGGAATSKPAGAAGRPEPIRREDILVPFTKALGTGIYEGRVKGKGVMGFFRPKLEEIRIKRHADIETAAHEMAHFIDHRVPEIRKSWHSGKDWQVHREELRGLSYDSGKIYEGFAEFVRHYMTQPDVAKARAPTFHKWFEDFVGRHEYGPAIRKARDGMTAWFQQDAIDRARSKIGEHRLMTEALDGRWDAFRQATVDDLHGIYRMERELRGGKIAPNGPYESARLSRASASIADGAIRFGAPVKRPDGAYGWQGKGLEEILRPVADRLDDAMLYFVGRSARELMSQQREHLFTPGEVDAMLKLRTPEFDKAFKEYQAWNERVLDFAEASGVINPHARMMWQRLEYMPFHRVGQPGGFKGKPGDWSGIKALTGGTENIRDVLSNMTANAAMLIDKAVKNEARQKIADLAQEAGGGKFMVKIPAEARPVKIEKTAVIDAILDAMGVKKGDPAAAAAEKRLRKMFEQAPAMLDLMQQNMPPAGGNVVAVLRNGKPDWYEVGDPILLRALESIDRQPPPWIVKWLGLPKRVGQMSITLTPDFAIANMARDTVMGSIMSRAGFRPVVDSLQGMRLRFTNDPLYKEYIANGGGLSSMFLDEAKLRTKLQRFYSRQGIDYRTVINTPDKMLEFAETLADAFETSTRLGEFKRAMEAGEHPRHAAYLGREVSTDFAMRGDSKALAFMYDTVMFLRPAVVSWDRMYRGLAHDPNKGAIATKAGMLALMSSALYLLNREDPRYRDLPDWDRDSNWHFFVGDQHFRYPKIWEIGALSSAAERTTEKIVDADPQGLGKDFARIVGTTFNLNLMPQILAPLQEQAANRNSFTKAPIETPGMENVQPFMRAKPNTSETMKAAGMATRDLPEALQVNPARTEALLRGYFNTWAMYGLMLSDKTFFGDKSPAMRTDQLPVVRRFYSQEPPLNTRFETEFYDMLGEARRLHGTLRELDKIGRQDIADQKETEPLAVEAKPLERASKNLQSINQEMRSVRRAEDLTPDEKRRRLDELTVERNDLLKRSVLEAKASLKANEK